MPGFGEDCPILGDLVTVRGASLLVKPQDERLHDQVPAVHHHEQ
jgi:hypothetical protein